MSKCEQCGIEYEAKRADSRFCSDKCRKAAARNNADKIIADTISPDKLSRTDNADKPANYGQPDCQCMHCQQNRSQPPARQKILNHGPYKAAPELADNEINRVSLSGDIDYRPIGRKGITIAQIRAGL